MRFLAAALALLLVGIANAEIQLGYPGFIQDKTLKYECWINTTGEVLGMASQVSKAVMNAELNIFQTKEPGVFYMSMTKVRVSNSVASVESKTEPMKLETDSELEEDLKIPTRFTLKNGRVESYTKDPHESIVSINYRKAVLRLLDIGLKKDDLQSSQYPKFPQTYNHTTASPTGNYSSHYVITSSPYAFFPKDRNVINITRTDNYEKLPYMTYHTHHNYPEQGCPSVCKKDPIDNEYSAGCPVDRQPHQTPMTQSRVTEHHLRQFGPEKNLTYDIMHCIEHHVADVYDQKMAVEIQIFLRHKYISSTPLSAPTGQTTHKDLHEFQGERYEEEIDKYCKRTTTKEAVPIVKQLLTDITAIIHNGSIEGDAKLIGEKLVMLQKASSLLKYNNLKKIQEDEIISHEDIAKASEEERIKRQIWLDNLPFIGTPDAVSFIVNFIKRNINEKYRGEISLWECKNILEALPLNIINPTCKTIQELNELLEALTERQRPGYGMYYSAAHMAVARVIRKMYDIHGISKVEDEDKPNYLQKLLKETDDDNEHKCLQTEAHKFLKEVKHKIKGDDRLKSVILLDVISQTNLPEAVTILKPYVEGRIPVYSPSYVDYLRTVAIYALHNLVKTHPKPIQNLVFPVYLNQTEAPKLRIAAFSVFIKSSPTLGNLQSVAVHSWKESSYEVGSYVYSILRTEGNSTHPCDQRNARLIHKIFSNVKIFDHGKHHAQGIAKTVYDGLKGFGIQNRYSVVPSNESFVPSAIYESLGYNTDSLIDYYFKLAINAQGFNSLNMWDNMLKALNLEVADNIPKHKESQIFEENKVVHRADEMWRFTYYLYYCGANSYYYMDDEEYQRGDFQSFLKQHIKNYLKWDSNGRVHGHITKMCMPSSYQAKSIAQSLSFPVEFDIRNPVVLSLEVDAKIGSDGRWIKVDATPSVYHSTHISHGILNVGDCKHVAVEHKNRLHATYPVRIELKVERDDINVSYTFPELPKKVLAYHSETGTCTKRHVLDIKSPSSEKTQSTEWAPIKTIPQQFVRKNTFGVIGLPVFESNILTEDISFGYEEVPRNAKETVHQVIKEMLNAGWRRKSIEVYRKPDSLLWEEKSKVTLSFKHNHRFITSRRNAEKDDKWMESTILNGDDDKDYEKQEKDVHDNVLNVPFSHDILDVSVLHHVNDRVSNKLDIQVDHNRTLEGLLHSLHVRANIKIHGIKLGRVMKCGAVYFNKPNEYNYTVSNEFTHSDPKGAIICIFKSDDDNEAPIAAVKIRLSREPMEKYLNRELQAPLPAKHYYPDTHDECLRDKKVGNVHSPACMKAARESAIFNRVHADVIWNQDLHPAVEDILAKVDLSIKHAFFKHLDVKRRHDESNRHLELEAIYIDKLTPRPVYDIKLKTPKEEITIRKVELNGVLPFSSIYSPPEVYTQHYSNNSYPATCTVMQSHVRTYDQKTIRLPRESSCSYILTSHCARLKKFAITGKIDSEIHAYIGKHEVVLKPGQHGKFEVVYDRKSYTVEHMEPIMLHEGEKIYAVTNRLSDGSHYVELYAELAGIKVTYTGQLVRIQAHPRYKGELCGLCSEFNGEVFSELRGPNRCLYSNDYDYAASCALGECYHYKGSHKSICSSTDYDQTDVKDQDDHDEDNKDKEYKPISKRNKVVPKGERICISKAPTPVCESRDEPKETENKPMEFHCLPKRDSRVRELIRDSKRRILGELETKHTDLVQDVEHPTLCVSQ